MFKPVSQNNIHVGQKCFNNSNKSSWYGSTGVVKDISGGLVLIRWDKPGIGITKDYPFSSLLIDQFSFRYNYKYLDIYCIVFNFDEQKVCKNAKNI